MSALLWRTIASAQCCYGEITGLTHSLHYDVRWSPSQKWLLHVCRTSYDLLLQFPLFTHSKLEQHFRNERFWPARLLWESILGRHLHERYNALAGKGLTSMSKFYRHYLCESIGLVLELYAGYCGNKRIFFLVPCEEYCYESINVTPVTYLVYRTDLLNFSYWSITTFH